MSLYKVGIVGYGVVGKGIHRLLDDAVKAIFDPGLENTYAMDLYETFGKINWNVKEEFKDLDLTVICVPTNEGKNWKADTSIVEDSVEWVREINPEGVILIKSTTPPSVVEKLQEEHGHIVFSPEYMGESKYFTPEWKYPHPQNMESHTWQTFGGNKEDTSLCVDIFKRRMGVDTQFYQTDLKTASMAKYMENSFFALKVTFVNEWFDMAEAVGVDFNELRELWLADPRINRNHTLVFPKDRGYGGKCFPKDTRAIMAEMHGYNYDTELMHAMDRVNENFRKEIK